MGPSKTDLSFLDANPNIVWASIFVNELANCGLSAVCLAPGSRSTPLALAFHAHPDIKVFVHLDERSAAFFALGLALAAEKSVAVLSTSGTAGANFFPAIIEARMSQIPLIVLTADRPHELRHSGANQTIDQIKMFGDQVLWSVDVGLPEAATSENVIRYLRALAARAIFTAEGFEKGPVHLNFPFRKPLEPANIEEWRHVKAALGKKQPFTRMEKGIIQPAENQIGDLTTIIEKHPRGIIVCGPDRPDKEFPEILAAFSKASGYPVLADPLSGIRFGPHIKTAKVIGGYETFLTGQAGTWPQPDIIIRFGRTPTSKWLHEYLRHCTQAQHIHIRENGIWADEEHMTNHFIQASPTLLCRQLTARLQRSAAEDWASLWSYAEKTFRQSAAQFMRENYFDGAVISRAVAQIPDESTIFSGNSLPIRHIDQYCQPADKHLRVFSNRGASGIDGNISTGLGLAAQTNERVLLLLGDITFYHDSNGLLAIKKFALNNVTIILVNNNGGGIFGRLPIAQFEEEFKDLFKTAHDLQFEPYAIVYGLEYKLIRDLRAFEKAFNHALASSRPTLIEVQTNSHNDELIRRELISQVNSLLAK